MYVSKSIYIWYIEIYVVCVCVLSQRIVVYTYISFSHVGIVVFHHPLTRARVTPAFFFISGGLLLHIFHKNEHLYSFRDHGGTKNKMHTSRTSNISFVVKSFGVWFSLSRHLFQNKTKQYNTYVLQVKS